MEKAIGLSWELNSILKKVSRTLYLSLRALPAPVRKPMSVAYLLCRAADSVTDTGIIPLESRLHWIRTFPKILGGRKDRPPALGDMAKEIPSADHQEISGSHSQSRIHRLIGNGQSRAVTGPLRSQRAAVKYHSEKKLLSSLDKCLLAYDSLPQAQRLLVLEVVKNVCAGMCMDLTIFTGEDSGRLKAMNNAGQLEKYCSLMGGAPGVFWTKLYRMTIRHAKVSECPDETDGKMIGAALQMTDILQDIASDLRIGRCYLPSDELTAAGLSPLKLLDPDSIAGLQPVLSKWIRRAVSGLDRSERYLMTLPKNQFRLRAAVIWPVYWAMDTLAEIAKARHLLDPSRRTKISRRRIYSTILRTPATLSSDMAFSKGYRLRRETLLSGLG